ncbi:DUF802 domain-containing protein [Variovorax sp. LT2P21]|uniref:DUF802 domain-containing protein n=1 Tax=Variovorax sp. LT2P21 TaxID=3443731 RepID=UPI003F458959
MNRFLQPLVFAAGLAAIGWVGVGYIGHHPLALAITALIAVFYLIGALELHRYQRATVGLADALQGLNEAPARLGPWLDRIDASLQNAVRLRIEGERVGLPGPALTPYLAGLLVLLGMLGTFLGMVVTLNGTGAALQGATDLQSIRDSLSAPVKGLGLAFGTSVAGVAASAMLGLMSALCRRARLQAGQQLDTRIATTLRPFSLAHQREASFQLLERQAQGMPELVAQLSAMTAAMERQSEALSERLLAGQDRFHTEAGGAYTGLAASVDRALKDSLIESARLAGATIRPVVEEAMAGIARETTALHGAVAQTVQQQLDGVSARFDAATGDVTGTWKAALADHRQTSETMAGDLRQALNGFSDTFAQRSAALVDGVSTRLDSTVGTVSTQWSGALAQHERTSAQLAADTQQALTRAADSFVQQAAGLLQSVDQAHAGLQTDIASRDAQRLAAWTQALEAMAAALRQEWQQAGEHTVREQRQLGETLTQAVREMSERTEAQAKSTITEVAGLLQAAAEAPRAAAEVVAELRTKLSDSMARDNTMLEERARILETLGTLLDAVNHASTEQRAAIDTLVASSADLLERVGGRLTGQIGEQADKLATVGAQITGSAVEVASLGEAFGFAVERFGESNDKLVAHLQRIEGALGKSITRSDEQLAYYVAQAREVIDLSIMSQKQIVEDLQQIAARQTAGSDA